MKEPGADLFAVHDLCNTARCEANPYIQWLVKVFTSLVDGG